MVITEQGLTENFLGAELTGFPCKHAQYMEQVVLHDVPCDPVVVKVVNQNQQAKPLLFWLINVVTIVLDESKPDAEVLCRF
jgi:hypothetical protein